MVSLRPTRPPPEATSHVPVVTRTPHVGRAGRGCSERSERAAPVRGSPVSDRPPRRERQRARRTGRPEWSTMQSWPSGFMWGTGASSTQTEGASAASDWLQWERDGHAPTSGDGSGFATRYAEDFAQLAALG